jgi:hypothetical protein
MLCGFCGTNINPGFNTCAGCGATYKKVMGCFGNIISGVAVILLFFGLMATILGVALKEFAGGVWIGIPMIGVAVGILYAAVKTARYQWIRPRRRVD